MLGKTGYIINSFLIMILFFSVKIMNYYIKYPDETLTSIFSLNLIATIDDERYLVHIESNYPRPGAVNTLPSSLNRQNAEITEKYIS